MLPKPLSSLLLVVLSLLPVSGCQSPQAPPPGGPLPVQLTQVQTRLVTDTSRFNASLQSRRAIQLRPQVSGRIAQILVRSGQTVPANTPVLQIDPAEQEATVASNQAAIQAAAADIDNARDILLSLEATRRSNQADLDYKRWQADRYTALAKEGAVSLDTAKSFTKEALTAQATLAATEAQIRAQRSTIAQREKELLQAQANTRQATVQLQYYQVRAPFTGIVGDIPPKLGDYVTPDTNLLTLTQNQPLEAYIQVPIERSPDLQIGMLVELLNPEGKVIGTSRIFFISPTTDDNTQTVLVKALYDNSGDRLRSEQQIQAQIVWQRRPGVLVPTTAVTNLVGENFVFVAEQDKSGLVARQKAVELGRIEGNNYQVLSGLQAGEKIVTSGLQKLADGVPIKPES
uniref:Efflux transporter, RND family, MFP subunit n=1 Tax=Cyanothece sp. (strain PCC 7425 / ATCC 29141) TaxID=395961 RepID=B8HNG3_CYAP4